MHVLERSLMTVRVCAVQGEPGRALHWQRFISLVGTPFSLSRKSLQILQTCRPVVVLPPGSIALACARCPGLPRRTLA